MHLGVYGMGKADSLKLSIELAEALVNHLGRIMIVTSAGWVYSCLNKPIKDEGLNEALEGLEESLKRIDASVESYLFGTLLIDIITEVERYLVDVLRCILKAFPKKIKNMKFDLSDILGKSNDEIIQTASERYINELMYKRPLEYLESFSQIISVDPEKIKKYWPDFVEAKARRDLGIHSNWNANEIYFRKLADVGLTTKFNVGDPIYPDNSYVQHIFDSCSALIESINNELKTKFGSKEKQA